MTVSSAVIDLVDVAGLKVSNSVAAEVARDAGTAELPAFVKIVFVDLAVAPVSVVHVHH